VTGIETVTRSKNLNRNYWLPDLLLTSADKVHILSKFYPVSDESII